MIYSSTRRKPTPTSLGRGLVPSLDKIKRLNTFGVKTIYMESKKCFECSFDTVGIVTVDTSSWKYCPECGSHLVDENFDRKSATQEQKDDNNQKVTEVPIGEKPEADSDSSKEDSEEDSEESSGIEIKDARKPDDAPVGSQMTTPTEEEQEDRVEKELDQLRDRYDDEDEDN